MRQLVEAAGGPAAWARTFGGTRWQQPQVSAWISASKPKSIGRNLARALEEVQGLPHGHLDSPPPAMGNAITPKLRPVANQRSSSPAAAPLTVEQQALLADYVACSPADRAEQLLPLASPRSRSALEYIIQAALDNRLTERDLELLQSIAVHITGRHPPGPIDAALKQRAKGRARTPR